MHTIVLPTDAPDGRRDRLGTREAFARLDVAVSAVVATLRPNLLHRDPVEQVAEMLMAVALPAPSDPRGAAHHACTSDGCIVNVTSDAAETDTHDLLREKSSPES